MALPMDQEQLVTIQISAMLSMGIVPLHLSKTKSVNLTKVTSYQEIELEADEDLDAKPAKKTADNVLEMPAPTMVRAIYLEGNDEPMILSQAEDDVFRPYWNAYTQLAKFLIAGVNQIAASVATVPAAIPGGTQ